MRVPRSTVGAGWGGAGRRLAATVKAGSGNDLKSNCDEIGHVGDPARWTC